MRILFNIKQSLHEEIGALSAPVSMFPWGGGKMSFCIDRCIYAAVELEPLPVSQGSLSVFSINDESG